MNNMLTRFSLHEPKFWVLSIFIFFMSLTLHVTSAWTFQPQQESDSSLRHKAFVKPELHISSSSVPLSDILDQMPNRNAFQGFSKRHGQEFHFHIDPRSGTPANILGHIPIIPGSGKDNHLTNEYISAALGRTVTEIYPETVSEQIKNFITSNQDVLNIDVSQVGPINAHQVTDDLWQVSIPQTGGHCAGRAQAL